MKSTKINNQLNELCKKNSKIFESSINKIFNDNNTLFKFKSMKDLNYKMFDNKEHFIRLVLKRTWPSLVHYTHNKIFFQHCHFTRYGSDINGDIFDLKSPNQERVYSFYNIIKIFIMLPDGTEKLIQYNYLKFLYEALHLYPVDILKDDFLNNYKYELNNEDNNSSYTTLSDISDFYTYNDDNKDNHDDDNHDDTDDDTDNDNDNDDDTDNDNDNDDTDNDNVNDDDNVNDNDNDDDTVNDDDTDNDNDNDDNVNDNDNNHYDDNEYVGNCEICGDSLKLSDL